MFFRFAEYFLPLIIVFGIITSFDDISEGKIKNKHILLSIICGILLHLFLFLSGVILPKYFLYYSVNIIVTILIAFFLYFINFWSAGDGKLLIAYSFIMPLTIYENFSLIYFVTPLLLIINTFIPYFIITAFCVFINDLTAHKKGIAAKDIVQSSVYSMLYVFSVMWIAELFLKLVGLPLNYLSLILFSAVIIGIIEKLKLSSILSYFNTGTKENQKKAKKIGKPSSLTIAVNSIRGNAILIIISILRVIIEYKNIFTVEFAVEFIIFYMIMMMIRSYLRSSTSSFFTKNVHILQLARGMVINDNIIKKKEKYIKLGRMDLKSSLQVIYHKEFPDVLDDNDVKRIVKMYKSNKLDFNKVNIQNTMPFAPLMFFGAILTIITKASYIFLFRL